MKPETVFFIEDVLLMDEEGVTNPRFIKYLIKTQDFQIRKTLSSSGSVTNYEGSYYGEPCVNENGVKVRPVTNFKTINGVIENNGEFRQDINDIRYNYDNWRELERNKILKRGGIATVVVVSLVTLITGLSLGLKRGRSDIKSSAIRKKIKAEKLTPAEKRNIIPWTDIEEASGKGLIFIGDHLYLIIGGSLICLYSKKKK